MLGLDFKTMVVMATLLTFCMSALLIFMRFHGIRGPEYWATGNLFISFSMLFVVFHYDDVEHWVSLILSLMVFGQSVRLLGIRRYVGHKVRYYFPFLMVGGLLLLNVFTLAILNNQPLTVFVNSMGIACLHIGSAWLLNQFSIKPERAPAERTACQVTAFIFSSMALLMIYRAITALFAEGAILDHPMSWYPNVLTLLIGSMLQMFVTFGLVMMVSYRKSAELEQYAHYDVLTGILNRRGLEEAARRLSSFGRRNDSGLVMLLLDIDLFKHINDRWGHPVGDEVLRQLTQQIKALTRQEDILARYGGEEFCLLLPATTEKEGIQCAERIRKAVEALSIPQGDATLRFTVSVGITCARLAGYDFRSLLASADAALYAAKKAGRNQGVSYSSLSGLNFQAA
ncbi:GGDEF domain-containing protein [Methylovorus mays]|uniref:GGDEF domain-containing protein n=1 Tax=Methylovorus mays TaxID=184077 RepID=UPI001E62B7CC|nr:GGDEF domain-containing protein [Methylovorus mays]MCB5206650.1 GGDEF domain-containing protein [Methylovorus mays]